MQMTPRPFPRTRPSRASRYTRGACGSYKILSIIDWTVGISMRPSLLVITPLLFAAVASGETAWRLAWSDEFDGPAGSKPNPVKWTYDIGATVWGNNEWERYTDAAENSHLDGKGNLVIRAKKVGSGTVGAYTSARLKTQDKFSTRFGKIEARIRIPYGQGIWPAFWMLGVDIAAVDWPKCGEIDIMENIGKETSTVHGTIHGPGYSGGEGVGKSYSLPGGQRFADDFHVYAVEWKAESVEFFVDGNAYHKVTPGNLPPGTEWVFRKPFFLLLNVAVGGNWPGYPDQTTVFPQEMTIDYVRVWEEVTGAGIYYDGGVNATSFRGALATRPLATIFGVNHPDRTAGDLFDKARRAFPSQERQ